MKSSLVELVDVIVRRIQEHPDARPTEKGLRTWLRRQGYTKRDIDAALKLVGRHFSVLPTDAGRATTVRMYSAYEEYKLSPQARQALTRLEVYGLLEPYEREMILDYANHFEGHVDIEELDYLLSWMVCSNRDVECQQTFYSVFEGKGETLH